MTEQAVDSHKVWLDDVEYRGEFGSESGKLEIAAALADARALAGVTQLGLAERAGVSQAYVAKLEQGGANPTIGNIGRLFACIWMKPAIQAVPLDPSKSMESIYIEIAELIEPVSEVDTGLAWKGNISEIGSTSARETKITMREGGYGS